MAKRDYLFLIIALLSIATAFAGSAIDVSFNVELNAVDQNGTVFTDYATISEPCELSCDFPINTQFNIPENYTFTNYTLTSTDADTYTSYFTSTHDKSTTEQDDSVTVEVSEQPPENPPEEQPEYLPDEYSEEISALVCKDDRCDEGCVQCNDDSCHEPSFECVEELGIEKIFPKTIEVGTVQLNILLRNSGTVDLKNVYALISGDGVSTTEKIPIEFLPAGDKDYAFVKINASKAGGIDLVVKLFVNAKLKKTLVEQITVTNEKAETTATQEEDKPDATAVSSQLDQLKEKYRRLEQEFIDKKSAGYDVDFIYDSLKKAQDYIVNAQTSLFEGEYKKAESSIAIAEEFLATSENQLTAAKKNEDKFSDKVKNNMIYIGSLAAALVSTFTAYGLIKSNINKQKLAELKDKIKIRKETSKKVEKKRKPKKENNEHTTQKKEEDPKETKE